MSPESHREVINLTRLNEIRRQVASLTGEEKKLVLADTQKDLNSDYFEYNHSYKNLEQFLQNIKI